MRTGLLKSQQGLTLIEVMMGTLVLSIFIGGLVSLLTFTADQGKQITNKVDQEVDTIIGERFLFTDLRTATPSLNNVTSRDDNNREFFDFIPDVSPNSLTVPSTRQLTMSAQSNRQLVVISLDLNEAPPMLYDPTAAYRISPPPADFGRPGALSFVSLNQNNYVNIAQRTVMRGQAGNFWRDGKVMMLDTPARIRPVQANAQVSMATPPRSSIYLGFVSGATLQPILVNEIKRTHPSYASTWEVSSEDRFLRTVPPVSGAAPVIRLANVKIIRYSVSATPAKPGKVDLYREVHDGRQFANRQVVASGLVRAMFMRESIFQPMISFRLVYN